MICENTLVIFPILNRNNIIFILEEINGDHITLRNLFIIWLKHYLIEIYILIYFLI